MRRIRKLLIANRGEIAVRVLRTCADMGIATVAVYSEADRQALHVRLADEAVAIGPPEPRASYLDLERLLEAARRTGADAVHPGYGFLAENAEFAAACEAAGLVFVGPRPETIRAMGSKLAARRLVAAAGVPVIPGFDPPAPERATDAELIEAARRLGFPLLVKASAGGGGRGMRLVAEPAQLPAALASARREARAAFGDDTLYLEKVIAGARHIEVQVLGDARGRVIHLFERECSLQRRHQKVIEEAPSPALTEPLRARMCEAAVAAARAVRYLGAGTVEMLLAPDGAFYFLEMNTRLQVEHPVTEMITGLDLVCLQLLIAEGEPLELEQQAVGRRGHAIECRLYAEDPAAEFLPQSGRVRRLAWPEGLAGVRVDAGIAEGDAIGVYYDPLLAKLIAHAPSREEALRRMRHALERTAVLGVRTNRAWLHRVLGHPEVLAGRFDNTFLERHAAQFAEPAAARAAREQKARAVAAVALALQRRERAAAGAPAQPRPPGLPAGWRLHRSEDQWVDLEALWPGGPTSAPPAPPPAPEPAPQAAARTERARPAPPGRVRYRWTGPQSWLLVPQESADGLVPPPEQGGWQVELLHAELEPGAAGSAALRALELEIDGQARRWLVAIKDERIWVQGGAAETELRVLPRLPAGGQGGADGTPGPGGAHLATAPMPGRVLRVLVEPGAVLEPHAPLVILESMKTELTVSAAHPGVVRAVLVQPGEQVQAGAPLVELDGGEGAPAAAPEQGAPAGAGGAAAAGP